ncbi:MAG TPA: hypothetical protein DDX92_07100 [Flavobacteriales bacterium]|jgi:ubiquinone/menaquinone biosynthesis C-methylase UbiE|nr:hypothetical protein [Flavobacteriales bacterium]
MLRFARFFSKVQETEWYGDFLSPIVDEVARGAKVLDIGTGSGKLLQMMIHKKSIQATGLDTDQDMLDEARQKLNGLKSRLVKINPEEDLPFEDGSFDAVSICNLLFLLDSGDRDRLLQEANRVTQPNGRIFVLTPTGKGSFSTMIKYGHYSIFIWFLATRSRASRWRQSGYLQAYALSHNLDYHSFDVLNGMGMFELVEARSF